MAAPTASTPLMEQYHAVRAQYPGHIVLFRVGDFYECFGDEAKLLSRELELVLTARSPDKLGDRVPMAGVPHHALDSYLGRLVRKGYKVAVCDQMEDARFAKGLVRREVTRVVTPGTVLDERLLGTPDHNFLAAVVEGPEASAFAAVDVTTGELFTGGSERAGRTGLLLELAPFAPREILLPGPGDPTGLPLAATLRLEFPSARLEPAPAPADPARWPPRLAAALAGRPLLERTAAGSLLQYLEVAQPRLLPYLEYLPRSPGDRGLRLDGKTLRHLEITRPMTFEEETGPTLLTTWDATVTAPGRRTLAFWLKHPLADVAAIHERQETVAALLALGPGLDRLRDRLRPIADLSRIAARLVARRLRPPELAALRESLRAVAAVRDGSAELPAPLRDRIESLDPLPELAERLGQALPDEPPATVEAGHLFRPGYRSDLDRFASEEAEAEAALAELERTEAERSGIRSLKIGYNQVFGYYFEVTRPHLARVPAHFQRKQTLAGAERFTSEALAAIESRLLGARDGASEAERALWERFLQELEPDVPRIHRLSRAVGALDALASFARLARDRGLVRPQVDEGGLLQIRDGRHPLLDRSLGERFVPNDTELDPNGTRLWVLTGPNMSGKSTYMRQVGLLVVLAQAGSFVPARYARIGVVDALFTRMGFTDEIARGKSSFMVEMTELADILRGADARSLLLLDEVGRGTSTFDGLAIAWATLREIHDRVRCRTVLATHYHQLTELIESLPGAANRHLAVREEGGHVTFLHRLVPGATNRSFGLHVARLAGLPPTLLEEAERTLRRLESAGVELPKPRRAGPVGPRYTQAVLLPSEAPTPLHPLAAELADLDLDRLTPMQALELLGRWRTRLRAEGEGPP